MGGFLKRGARCNMKASAVALFVVVRGGCFPPACCGMLILSCLLVLLVRVVVLIVWVGLYRRGGVCIVLRTVNLIVKF